MADLIQICEASQFLQRVCEITLKSNWFALVYILSSKALFNLTHFRFTLIQLCSLLHGFCLFFY